MTVAKKSATKTPPPASKPKAQAPPPPPEPEPVIEEVVQAEETESEPQEDEAGASSPESEDAADRMLPGAAERKVVYAEVTSDVHCKAFGNSITVELAKERLGWEEEEEGGPQFGDKFVREIASLYGKKVRLLNNITNRPIYKSNLLNLRQELLMDRWELNAEPIIIGRTGMILNGQHCLIALILAEAERTGPRAEYWALHHSGPITMDKVITYGIEERDRVVNTMDTCKPRSLGDVIYRSQFFATKNASERQKASRTLEYMIRFLWPRLGAAGAPAFLLARTHSESLDFLIRHNSEGRMLRCVEHIMKENGNGGISKYVSPGTAAGLMFLMAVCRTDKVTYHSQNPLTGDVCDFSEWDRAGDFWVALNTPARPTFHELRMYLSGLDKADTQGRVNALCKAWNVFSSWDPDDKESVLTREDVEVAHHFRDSDGAKIWDESPSVGGIDMGPRKWGQKEAEKPVSEEEVEAMKAQVRKEHMESKLDEPEGDGEDETLEEEDTGEDPSEFSEEEAELEETSEESTPVPAGGVQRPGPAAGWKPPPSKAQVQSTRKGGSRGPRG